MVLDAVGIVVRVVDRVRLRVRCPDPCCEGRSWTLYEPQGYPYRTFTPAVAASAVAELAVDPEATLTSVAQRCQCDRRTAGRWLHWTERLMGPDALTRLCARLDPSGLLPPGTSSLLGLGGIALAGFLVLLLEHLARLLRNRGVALETGPGLAVILRSQFERFRGVSFLTRASPPLRVEPGWAGA